jgi:hypothetical protein
MYHGDFYASDVPYSVPLAGRIDRCLSQQRRQKKK